MKGSVDRSARNHCVYFHRIQGRGVFYIGMGLPRRPLDQNNRSKAWHEIVKLNPNYEVHILETDLTVAEAAQIEIDSIAFVGLENLVNRSAGGQHSASGMRHSEESRRKISLNNPNRRPENRVKMSKKMSGSGNPMFGRTHSESARERIRLAHTGNVASAETRLKMSEKRRGKNNGSYKDRLFVFVHAHFGYVICTQFELQRRFNLLQSAVSQIVTNSRRSTRGWRVATFV